MIGLIQSKAITLLGSACMVLLFALSASGWYLNKKIEENAVLEEQNKGWQLAYDSMEKNHKKLSQVLLTREEKKETARTKARAANEKIRELSTIESWGNVVIPEPYINSMLDYYAATKNTEQ